MLIKDKNYSNILLSFVLLVLLLTSCKSTPEFEYSIETELNPNRISPLTALLKIAAEKPCSANIKVLGESPIEQSFDSVSDSLEIPVVGLYPGTKNQVVVNLEYEGGTVSDTLEIETQALPNLFPRIEIDKLDRSKMEFGWHGCDMHFANNGTFKSIPLIFDDQGVVRWYLDLSFHGKMVAPFQRLQDGTILMAGRQTIYEFDMLGKQLKQTGINSNYGMHHDILEIPNGNLLICVGKRNAYINLNGEQILSDSDFIMEYSRSESKIVREWDLAKNLDVDRADLNFFRPGDWLHMNGLAYDEKDNSIIVSGKNQGLIKIGWDDELKWILAPKKNWGKSGRNGDGFGIAPYLLTAVDDNLNRYSDAIQNGISISDDFEFPWGPHAPKLLPNGNLLVFDNGASRSFGNEFKYSRAVEYKINEQNKTVEQIWQYGKERKTEFFSAIVSDVDLLPSTSNILVTSGYINPKENHSGKIVEVNPTTNEEVFEATLYFTNINGNGTAKSWGQSDILYRSQRMDLKY
jgi:arylsulfate sulfotransferase